MTARCWQSLVLVGILLGQAASVAGWQTEPPATDVPASTAQPLQQSAALEQPLQRPFPPLGAPMQEFVEKLLSFWESSSSQIQLYQCKFTRWEYDPQLVTWRNEKNHLAASAISKGKIRYATPDKGRYDVDERWEFAGPPQQPGGNPKFTRGQNEQERWICDGQSIYEYDFINKRLNELKLPPEAQGEGLKNSPLPFVFGAKAQELLDRYWVRDVTPPAAQQKGEYWIEAWPKRMGDAREYKKVEIILSRDPFLPKSIHLYAPNYDEKTNPAKMVFEFEDREINGHLNQLNNFLGFFIRPNTPRGWQRVQKKLMQDDPGQSAVPQIGQVPGQQNSK